MDDRDYKVVQVSSKEPKRWDGPNGTVYYINVKLEGHDKPVSVGKKSPDALKPGDTVYGHILVEQSYEEDKFKAGKKAFGGQQSFGGGKSNYTPRDDDAIRAQWALGQAVSLATKPDKKFSSDSDQDDYILGKAKQLFAWVNEVKGSSEGTNPKVPVTKSPVPKTSEPWKVNTKDPDTKFWASDDDAEAQSLYNSIAQSGGEPVDVPEGF